MLLTNCSLGSRTSCVRMHNYISSMHASLHAKETGMQRMCVSWSGRGNLLQMRQKASSRSMIPCRHAPHSILTVNVIVTFLGKGCMQRGAIHFVCFLGIAP